VCIDDLTVGMKNVLIVAVKPLCTIANSRKASAKVRSVSPSHLPRSSTTSPSSSSSSRLPSVKARVPSNMQRSSPSLSHSRPSSSSGVTPSPHSSSRRPSSAGTRIVSNRQRSLGSSSMSVVVKAPSASSSSSSSFSSKFKASSLLPSYAAAEGTAALKAAGSTALFQFPFPAAERTIVQNWLAPTLPADYETAFGRNATVGQIGSDIVGEHSFMFLKGGQWFSDELVQFSVALCCLRNSSLHESLSERRTYFYSTFFMSCLCNKSASGYNYSSVSRWGRGANASGNIFELQRLVIPVNVSNLHWIVLVVNFRFRTITSYDSLRGEFPGLLLGLISFFRDRNTGELYLAGDCLFLCHV
jgi:hypothetical protein